MGKETAISWTHSTFNPWWGCEKVSPACDHCYAERDSKRYGFKVWGEGAPRRFFGDDHWQKPVQWNAHANRLGQRRRVFCASMADVFENYRGSIEIKREMIETRARLWRLIENTPMLDWLLLTKRPHNIMMMTPGTWQQGFPVNVWVGTTTETQQWFDVRVPFLLRVPAVVRFISYEPALGPLDMTGRGWLGCVHPTGEQQQDHSKCAPTINWVIAGGESGAGFRDAALDWYRSVQQQCEGASCAFWFKQHSGLHPKLLGDKLDGKEYKELPLAA